MRFARFFGKAKLLGAAVATLALAACSGSDDSADAVVEAPANNDGSMITGLAGSPSASCGALAVTATESYRPIDVVFIIDNSASMDDEILAVERSINRDFAAIMEQSGLDYRVILISRYGKLGSPVGLSDNPICVGRPLANADCDPLPQEPKNGERFFHFSANVQSHDAWCVMLGSYDKPDEYGDIPRPGWLTSAPQGWSQYLRPEAFKTFVAISDDEVDCRVNGQSFADRASVSVGEVAAQSFDAALLKLSPEQFGTARKRNYVWHSIVGVRAFSPSSPAWLASAPMETDTCGDGAEGPGTGYQALSRLTGGLRYPSCDHKNFDAVFNTIARGIVGRAEIACRWQIPEPPRGERFDHGRVNVRYTPGSGRRPVDLPNVADASGCGSAGGWYYDNAAAPQNIAVCPSSCGVMRADEDARVDVLFGCETQTLVR
ncbi:MAG: hypothetical protein ACOY0T_36260 [Myxococcota bacterium]